MRPLEGATVLSLEHAVAAPFCTRQLADYGARVLKIERPGSGDFARGYDETVYGLSSHFVWLNRGKESITLDLKHEEAGILTALLQRERTGRGTRVEISMLESLVEWMGYAMYFGRYGGKAPRRTGATHPSIAPYGPHHAGDGGVVILGLQNEREWETFCAEVLGRTELARDPRFSSNSARGAHREELTRIIQDAFAGLSTDAAVRLLDEAGIANGRLNAIQEVVQHPQLAARHR